MFVFGIVDGETWDGKSGRYNATRSLGGKKTYVRLRCFLIACWVLMMNARTDGCTLSSVLDGSMMARGSFLCTWCFFERKSWSAVHNCSRSALSNPFSFDTKLFSRIEEHSDDGIKSQMHACCVDQTDLTASCVCVCV